LPDTRSPVYGPTLRHVFTEPLDTLRQFGRRALLALLGIAVGCASVVALLNIGHSASADALRTFETMGSDMLVAGFTDTTDGHQRRLPSQLNPQALLQALPGIRHAAPMVITAGDARLNGHTFNTVVVGTLAELAPVLELRMAQGRFLTPYDLQSTYAVLGATAARQLGASLGDRLQLGSYLFEVVGIMQERGQNPLLPLPVDESILLPIEGMRRLIPSPEIGSVVARSQVGESLPQQADALHRYLSSLVPGREVQVQIPQQLLAGLARQSRSFTWLLAGLGAVALLVGGVGVMNVMIMNVSERRREIGVRMALGARPQDIGRLFLLEATLLVVVGALAGAIVGLAAAGVFVLFSGWTFTLSPLSLPLGIGSSLLVGLFFGLHPALTAARLEPARALRDE
jgi:putative ABC transport system permease protein